MWTLSGVRIFVEEAKEEVGQIVPRLQPLSGGTVLQTFGYESEIISLNCIVIGLADRDSLKSMRTGGTHALVSPWGAIGSFVVKSVTVNGVRCICQTLRTDLDPESPVFKAEIQLYG